MPICIEPTHRPLTSQVVMSEVTTNMDEELIALVQKSAAPSLADLYRKAKKKGVLSARTSYQ